jgi:ABC-type dipeptide/oligopeptide/nickel transport system permease component
MNVRRINWPLWVGFLLTLAAFITYTTIFVWYPVTRDFPWASLLIFAVAVVLLLAGLRRGFASDRPHPTRSKIVSSLVGVLGLAVFAFFIFVFFVAAKWLPASDRAPQVGERAPEFSLPDTNGKQVALTHLLSTPVNGAAPKGVLLVFYRGDW